MEEKRGAKRDPEDAEVPDEFVPKTKEGEEAAVVSAAGAVEEREPGEVVALVFAEEGGEAMRRSWCLIPSWRE